VHEIVLSDVIDADELATGVRREGMYFGVMNFVERLSLVLISGATALVLGALAFRRFAAGGQGLGGIAMFCLCAAGCLYVFFFCGLLLVGLLVRLFSLGVRPGRHPAASLVTLCWLLAGGISTWSWRLMLPFVPMTFLSQMYYRLAGCRMGRDVYVNTLEVNDPYLVSIGDNSVIGGGAVIVPHVFESGRLILAPVVIGRDCLIGADAYLSPGVTIGDGSVIGLRVHLRKGTQVPPGSRILCPAGMSPHRVHEIEHGHGTRRG
jgi:hypothetical protein